MGKALYRKHRPKSLSEIIGQEHVTDTLSRALKKQMVSHAYLLTGPRGVGKTSIARILAYEVNGLPYDEEATHLDIIEIDAASNRRIDEIRELKERVNIAPTSAKYKVYIIDEVHMLTKEAFNALLKTLEEPPEHAIFILATTEAHKVPETIISRTQRFSLKPIEMDKVIIHLRHIAENEGIKIDDSALGLIAAHGEGSFRDSISLLDQVRHMSDHISLEDVQQAIGQAPDDIIDNLVMAVEQASVQGIATILAELRNHGTQPAQVAKQLSAKLRNDILGQTAAMPLSLALGMLNDLLQIPTSNDPGLALELTLFKVCLNQPDNTPEAVPTSLIRNEIKTAPEQTEKPNATPKPGTHETRSQVIKPKSPRPPTASIDGLNESSWIDVLAAVKVKHNTLYGIVRMGAPQFLTDKLILTFSFPFHQKRLNDTRNKQALLDIVHQVTGASVAIDCILDITPEATPITAPAQPISAQTDDINLQTISNIFGGAEIVE